MCTSVQFRRVDWNNQAQSLYKQARHTGIPLEVWHVSCDMPQNRRISLQSLRYESTPEQNSERITLDWIHLGQLVHRNKSGELFTGILYHPRQVAYIQREDCDSCALFSIANGRHQGHCSGGMVRTLSLHPDFCPQVLHDTQEKTCAHLTCTQI